MVRRWLPNGGTVFIANARDAEAEGTLLFLGEVEETTSANEYRECGFPQAKRSTLVVSKTGLSEKTALMAGSVDVSKSARHQGH